MSSTATFSREEADAEMEDVLTVAALDFGAAGWLTFGWRWDGESGRCGVCLADGDMEGFDSPSDDGACDALRSWALSFRERLLECHPWPSREDVCAVWEEMKEAVLRGPSGEGASVVPIGPADPERLEVYIACGGRGCAIGARRGRFADRRFVELLDRYFGIGEGDFAWSADGEGCIEFDGAGSVELDDDESVAGLFEMVALCEKRSFVRARDAESGGEVYAVNDGGFVRWGFSYAVRGDGDPIQDDDDSAEIVKVSDPHFTPYGDQAFRWEMRERGGRFAGEFAFDGMASVVRGVDIMCCRRAEDGVAEWVREFARALAGGEPCSRQREVMRGLSDATRRIDALRDGRLANMG